VVNRHRRIARDGLSLQAADYALKRRRLIYAKRRDKIVNPRSPFVSNTIAFRHTIIINPAWSHIPK